MNGKARAALPYNVRTELASVIQHMPENCKRPDVSNIWLGRSFAAQGKTYDQKGMYEKTAASGRNFYAVLAGEGAGRRINTRNNVSMPMPRCPPHEAKTARIKRAIGFV